MLKETTSLSKVDVPDSIIHENILYITASHIDFKLALG